MLTSLQILLDASPLQYKLDIVMFPENNNILKLNNSNKNREKLRKEQQIIGHGSQTALNSGIWR